VHRVRPRAPIARPPTRPPRRKAAACGRRLTLLLLGAVVSSVAALAPARAGTDPARTWFTLVSPHFALHTYDDGEALGRRALAYAEEAHAQVGRLLGWFPEERVHIVLTDDVDAANGWAMVLPYDTIALYAYPPEADGSLSDYDDWLRLLVFHEYAHVAHLDHATGLPRWVNRVLGKTWKPNQQLPRWFTEGLAVWVESLTSGAGRVSSSRFEMILRAAALADALPTLDQLTGTPLEQPGGTAWYMYGGILVDRLARAAGPAAMRRFLRSYGRRVVPFSLEQLARHVTGRSAAAWHAATLDTVRARARATAARIRRAGPLEGARQTRGGELKQYPRYTPDGRWLLYVRGDGHAASELVRAAVDPGDGHLGSPRRVWRCDGGCGRFAVDPAGEAILATSGRPYRLVNLYTDLVRLPLGRGLRAPLPRTGASLLTRGARTRDPWWQGDGRAVWVTRTAWGRTWLEARDPATGAVTHRWEPPAWARWGRLSTPVASPDGATVYVSMQADGNRDLYAVDVASGRLARLTRGASLEIDLTLSPDGRWLVYASDADGVYDLYARRVGAIAGPSRAAGRTVRLTRVVTGAFSPAVSPDGRWLTYVGWGRDGWDLYTLPFDPAHAEAVPRPEPRAPRPARAPPAVDIQRRAYSPLPTMLPRSWFPSWAVDTSGLSHLGLDLGGADITGRLGGRLAADYDLARRDLSAAVGVDIGLSWPQLSLSAGRYSWDRYSFVGDRLDPYREEVYYATLAASLALPGVVAGSGVSAGFTVDVARAQEQVARLPTPDQYSAVVPFEGFSTRLDLGWSFSSVEQYRFSVSPADGVDAAFGVRLRLPALGSHRTAISATYRLRGFLTFPWGRDHVGALRVQGGWSGGKPGEFSGFSLGGVPEQDLLVDLFNQAQEGAAWLRGFAPDAFSGTTYHLVNAEYRLPLWRARRGLDTLPFNLRDLHGALFADAGLTYTPATDGSLWRALGQTHVGLGLELRADLDLFYGLPVSVRLGYARGVGSEGTDQVYVLLAPAP